MKRDKSFFRGVLLHYFDLKKSAAETCQVLAQCYGESAPSESTCQYWFRRFRAGNFDLEDKERPGQPQKFRDDQLEALLNENPARTLKELATALDVTEAAVSKRLHAMGKIQKERKRLSLELSESAVSNRFNKRRKQKTLLDKK